jgi:hypothetical protein
MLFRRIVSNKATYISCLRKKERKGRTLEHGEQLHPDFVVMSYLLFFVVIEIARCVSERFNLMNLILFTQYKIITMHKYFCKY